MNVATVLEEKQFSLLVQLKFQGARGAYHHSVLWATARLLVTRFQPYLPSGRVLFKGVNTWVQSKISSYCFVYGVNQENQETGEIQDSYVQPQWWRPSQIELHLESPQKSMTELPCENSQRPQRSSHPRCSVRKGVLRNFAKFTGKHLRQSIFLIK